MRKILNLSFVIIFTLMLAQISFAEERKLTEEQYERLLQLKQAKANQTTEAITTETSNDVNVADPDATVTTTTTTLGRVGGVGVRTGRDVNQAQRAENNTAAKAGAAHRRK